MIRISLSTLALVLISSGSAVAQTTVAPADQSADIVVTGRGLADAPGDRAYDIVTIDRDRIQANASNRLESVLSDVAGLQQFRRSDSRSANPTSQGISLRGIGGNASSRALLIFDGVPQADPFGGWVAFPAYATGRLGRIRVTRGGGSGYQGPGALAGTVELESATPDQAAPFQGSVAYGSRDSVDAQGSAALVRGSGFATLSGAYARGDGFTPTVEESRGIVDRAAPYEQVSGALRTVVGIGAKTELQMNASAFADRRDRGSDFTDNKSEGADASVRLIGRGRWGYSALAYLQTRAFASSFNSVNAARTTAIQSLNQYNTPATGLGGRIEIAPPLGESITLRLGADVRDVSGKTQELYTFVNTVPTRRREAGGSTTTTGVFADGSLVAGDFTFSLGGRVDWWSIDGGYLSERPLAGGAALTNLRYADRDGSETTGRAGVAYQPVEAITLRAAGYRGWRLPTLNELYRPFRVGNDATAANALLAPERLTGVDACAGGERCRDVFLQPVERRSGERHDDQPAPGIAGGDHVPRSPESRRDPRAWVRAGCVVSTGAVWRAGVVVAYEFEGQGIGYYGCSRRFAAGADSARPGVGDGRLAARCSGAVVDRAAYRPAIRRRPERAGAWGRDDARCVCSVAHHVVAGC